MSAHSLTLPSLLLFSHAAFGSPLYQPTSFRVGFRRSDPGNNDTSSGNETVFDPTFVTSEIKAVLAKYAKADEFLAGIGLNPDTHPEEGYQNFSSNSTAQAPSIGTFVQTSLLAAPEDPTTDPVANPSADPPADPPADPRAAPPPPSGSAGPQLEKGTARMPLRDFISGQLDVEYYGPLSFGTPAQVLDVDIDTGSADLWVPARCASCPQDEFEPQTSSSFRASTTKCAVSYAKGRVAGELVQDVVSVGPLSVHNQTFCAARRESADFAAAPASGLLGLAFGAIAASGQPTFFENLLAGKQLAQSVFSVHLTRKRETGSEVCFGCFDATKALSKPRWHAVVSRSYWSIAMDGLSVSPTPNSTKSVATNLTAAIDTGTTLIYLPPKVTADFYAQIPGSRPEPQYGAEFYSYPCNTVGSVALRFGGAAHAFNPADFNLGRVQDDPTNCVGGVLGLGGDFPPDLAVVGAEFLKSWYSVFDYTGSVGFARSINEAGRAPEALDA